MTVSVTSWAVVLACLVVPLVIQAGMRIAGLVNAARRDASFFIEPDDRASQRLGAARLIREQVFDPRAAVVVTGGADGAAGRRNVDDNFDGTVDDAGEFGAMGSDDRIVTTAKANSDRHPADRSPAGPAGQAETPEGRVLSRGTYRDLSPVQRAADSDRSLSEQRSRRRRNFYTATVAGRTRVWMETPPEHQKSTFITP